VAGSLHREGNRAERRESRFVETPPDARLLLAVLLVENPWLDTDLDANICHGARLLSHTLRRSHGDLDLALLLYNGCIAGTSTSDCHLYPEWVRGKLAYSD
jgi:hypothetical protein